MKLRKLAIVGAGALALMGTVTSVVLVHGNSITKDKKSDYAETERLRGDRTHDIVEVSESIADDSFMGENVTGKNDYYKNGRGIACWGDSMTEGMGSDEGYILTDVGRVDISYYTSPYTIERLTGYRTYNLGVSGEKSDEISRRAGGLGMYTDRDLYITKYEYIDVVLVDKNGEPIHMYDYSGYGIEYNEYPDTVYIDGILCQIENRYEDKVSKQQQDIEDAEENSENWLDILQDLGEELIPGDYENLNPEDYVVGIRICDNIDENQPDELYVAQGNQVIPKAAEDHRNDILIIEMGSNGGWDNYDELIAQYQSIIDYTGCEDYIIVGDTDDPGSSLADEGVINMDNSEGGTGKNYTDWEVALRDAFGEHFFNTRVYMLEYGLSNCGLKASALDRLYAAFGCISGKLRSDWTHFNAYGYYAKGLGLYQKGVELGYWE
ncbi:MAG: hypothetical protein MR496_06300 [Eubacterium sp.]|nr:hypothetical protein [Eubacterium sp.]